MPHKNGWCNGTEENPHLSKKYKHHKWIKPNYSIYSEYGVKYWDRELICPECGKIVTDIKARWNIPKKENPNLLHFPELTEEQIQNIKDVIHKHEVLNDVFVKAEKEEESDA